MNGVDARVGSGLRPDPGLQRLDEEMAIDILSDGKDVYKTESKVSAWKTTAMIAVAIALFAITLIAAGFALHGAVFAAGIGFGLLAFSGAVGFIAYRQKGAKAELAQVSQDAGIYRLNRKVDYYNRLDEDGVEMAPVRRHQGRRRQYQPARPHLRREDAAPRHAARRPHLALA